MDLRQQYGDVILRELAARESVRSGVALYAAVARDLPLPPSGTGQYAFFEEVLNDLCRGGAVDYSLPAGYRATGRPPTREDATAL